MIFSTVNSPPQKLSDEDQCDDKNPQGPICLGLNDINSDFTALPRNSPPPEIAFQQPEADRMPGGKSG